MEHRLAAAERHDRRAQRRRACRSAPACPRAAPAWRPCRTRCSSRSRCCSGGSGRDGRAADGRCRRVRARTRARTAPFGSPSGKFASNPKVYQDASRGSQPPHAAGQSGANARKSPRRAAPPGRRWRAMASRPADAMQPQLEQSGLPPNWHGAMWRSKSADTQVVVCANVHSAGLLRRLRVHLDHALGHPQLRERLAQRHQRRDHSFAVLRLQAFLRDLADLRRVQAHPDLADVGIVRPDAHELLEVAVAPHLLLRHGAVHRDAVSLDVLDDAVVGRRLAALVVLRLEPVDRDDQLQPRAAPPTRSESGAPRWSRAGYRCRGRPAAAGSRSARESARAARRRRSRDAAVCARSIRPKKRSISS